jgi:pyruvate/2-oxoglutarate dehydrogenase complex dihydrolipoamide dehydrogenase (E3) component
LPGLETVPALDSTSIMELAEIPAHLVVLGGGYVGLEFGQMFRRFGSAVTIVQRGPALMAREDQDIADAVAEVLRQDGIEVLLSAEALGVAPSATGVALRVRVDGAERVIDGSHLLVATGRVPNSEALHLAAAGVRVDARGFVTADDHLQTNVEGIYAVGEINGGPAFTHTSYDDFRVVRSRLLGDGSRTITGRLVPYVMFTDPQLGRVGMSEREARASGRELLIGRMPMAYIARAIETDETRGVIKVIVDARSEELLGVAVLGVDGGEIMSALQIAMMARLPYPKLRDGIWAHPTLAEGFNNLFGGLVPG